MGYRTPYEWQKILDFLFMRAIPGVETVRDGFYFRTVRQMDRKGKPIVGWIKIGNKPEKNVLSVTISESLIMVLPQILAHIRRLFDLYCDPEVVYEALSCMNEIITEVYVKGTRVPGCMEPFEMSARAVLGQQITVRAARTLAGRMAEKLGTPIETGIEGLNYLFPSPEDILKLEGRIEDHLGSLGIFGTCLKYIKMKKCLFMFIVLAAKEELKSCRKRRLRKVINLFAFMEKCLQRREKK